MLVKAIPKCLLNCTPVVVVVPPCWPPPEEKRWATSAPAMTIPGGRLLACEDSSSTCELTCKVTQCHAWIDP